MDDRAPGEVETVAQAIHRRFGSYHSVATCRPVARAAIAALDAVRKERRDD